MVLFEYSSTYITLRDMNSLILTVHEFDIVSSDSDKVTQIFVPVFRVSVKSIFVNFLCLCIHCDGKLRSLPARKVENV